MTTMTTMNAKKNKLNVYAPSLKHALVAKEKGADIISVNGPHLGLRGERSFLSWKEIDQILDSSDVEIHLRINTVIHNQDLSLLQQMLEQAQNRTISAIQFSDIAVLQQAKAMGVIIPLTMATETTITNMEMIRFWNQQGVRRFLLSRELGLSQLHDMVLMKESLTNNQDIEFELQVHGPIGIFHTLRPVISNYREHLSLNQADKQQTVEVRQEGTEQLAFSEELRPQENYRVIEDSRGTYIFSSFDMSLYEYLQEIVPLKFNSLKIEFYELQSVEAMSQVVQLYRSAIDEINEGTYYQIDDWKHRLELANQFPVHNQFIKTGAPK